MSTYKLTYFDARGLSEPIRLAFAYAGQKFEDQRIQRDQWAAMKESMPYGQLPVLEVDGKTVAQSAAILRFVGNRFNLAGNNEFEKAKVDGVLDYFKDIQANMTGWFREEDQERKAKLREKFFSTDIQNYTKQIEKQIEKEYVVASGPTIADFVIASQLYNLNKINPEALKHSPKLLEYIERINNLKGIKDWIAKRPQSEM